MYSNNYFNTSIILVLLLAISIQANCQYSLGGKPFSLRGDNQELSSLNEIDEKVISNVNVDSVKKAEKALQQNSEHPIPPRFGIGNKVNLNLDNSGSWTSTNDGGRVWRLKIHSPGAKSLNFIFDQYQSFKDLKIH